MRVAIIGSRDYPCEFSVREYIQLVKNDELTIVSGGARGVDSWAADEARKQGIPVIVFPAEWDRFGKSAGYIRNRQIVEASDLVIAFYDGNSKGTAHTMRIARELGKALFVYGANGKLLEKVEATA